MRLMSGRRGDEDQQREVLSCVVERTPANLPEMSSHNPASRSTSYPLVNIFDIEISHSPPGVSFVDPVSIAVLGNVVMITSRNRSRSGSCDMVN